MLTRNQRLVIAASALAVTSVAMITPTGVSADPLSAGAASAGAFTLNPETGNSDTEIRTFLGGTDTFCPGDAEAGFSWSTFLVPSDVDVATLTWGNVLAGLADVPGWTGDYVPALTDTSGTFIVGQAPGLDDGFVAAPTAIDFSLATAYGTLPVGEYKVGIACIKQTGPTTTFTEKYWEGLITFTADPTNGGTNGFTFVSTVPEEPEEPIVEPVDPTEPAGQIAASSTYCVPAVGARPGEFIGVNITPVNATRNGNGSLHSSDDDPPSTANVNFRAGSVDPNVAFAQVGADGEVCFTNSVHGPVDVVMDALVVADADSFELPSESGAVRIADTRSGTELGGSTLSASETRCVAATGGTAGQFAGVNITPVNATTNGNGSLHSSDDDPPSTANVNFAAGSVDPNLAFAQIGADGNVCFTNSIHGPVDIVMDLLILGDESAFTSPTSDGAVRLVDTRTNTGASTFNASQTQCFGVQGADPADWIGVNLTPVQATTNGNGALHSSDDDPPSTANVNFRLGSVDPNLALVEVGADGEVCFTNSIHGPVDLVADELIVAPAGAFRSPTEDGAYRLGDTREGLFAQD